MTLAADSFVSLSFFFFFLEKPGKNAAQNCFRITQIQKQVARAYGNAEGLLLGGKLDEGGDLLEKIFGCPF